MSTAPQQPPPNEINQHTRVPIGWVVAAAAIILGGGVALGAAHWRLQTMDADFREHMRESARVHAEALKSTHAMELQQVEFKGDIRRMADGIESIDRKIDDLKEEQKVKPRGPPR